MASLLVQWIKVNTDGISKGNPSDSVCGGVFGDQTRHFVYGFSINLGLSTLFVADLYSVILALE